jgi:hypothetical protein
MLTKGKNPVRTSRLVLQEAETQGSLLGRTIMAIEYSRCAPPDEATVTRLNALAAACPFCRIHKAKRHEVL